MSMESIRIENMYDLNETIAAEIFEDRKSTRLNSSHRT